MFLFRFRNECPDGKLTKQHLKTLFEKVFPDGEKNLWFKKEKLNHAKWSPFHFVPSGNASKITTQIFRIFDSDGNDFLDFKEFLMAIDVANRTTGGFGNFSFKKSSIRVAKCQFIQKIRYWNQLFKSAPSLFARCVTFLTLSSIRWGEAEVVFPSVRHGQQRGDRHGGDDRHHWDSRQHWRRQARWGKKRKRKRKCFQVWSVTTRMGIHKQLRAHDSALKRFSKWDKYLSIWV